MTFAGDMNTFESVGVSGSAPSEDEFLKLSDIARKLGCSRNTISKKVKRLSENNLLFPVRDGNFVRVRMSEYKQALENEKNQHAALYVSPITVRDHSGMSQPVLTGKAKKDLAQARLLEIDLAVKEGKLLDRRGVEEGLIDGATKIVQALEAITNWSDDLISIGSDPAKTPKILRQKTRTLRENISNVLAGAVDNLGTKPE